MVKPNQYDVEQDGQKKEGDVDEEDPTVDVFVDGRKIFRADKLLGRIVRDAVNRSAAKRVDRHEKIEDRQKFSYLHDPTPRTHTSESE